MTYIDCITIAAQHAQDWDVPVQLLPLVIGNEAALRCGHEAGHIASAGWD